MQPPTRGFVWEVFQKELLVVSYSDAAERDDQWRSYFALLETFRAEDRVRFMVYAQQAPSRATLERIMRVARGKPWRVAVMSPSVAVRFAASTFSFVVRSLRFFAPDELARALEHLECNEVEQRKVRDALNRLRGPGSIFPR